MTATSTATQTGLIRASVADTLAFVFQVLLPPVAKGVLIRRPTAVAMAERFGLDARGIKRVQEFRSKYGTGPLLFRLPGRPQAIVLCPEDVRRVLDGTPEPFSPASGEKRAALAHFEPDVSLISRPPERIGRRRFNDEVLESGAAIHSLADAFLAAVEQEAERLLSHAGGQLTWNVFGPGWQALARRIVLGSHARDDDTLTDDLARLRAAANWVFLHPGRKRLLDQFQARLEQHLARAEPDSLAGLAATIPSPRNSAPVSQVTHWLFAFDAAGIATFRALALLAAHPCFADRAREDARAGACGRTNLPLLRATLLESLRLWPTTPMIFRETTQETMWDGGAMPENTSILIFVPFFHRDDEKLPYAHRFTPELWLENDAQRNWPLVPFSGGSGICPGRHIVTMLGSAMLSAILGVRTIELTPPAPLAAERPLPGTLNHAALRLTIRPFDRGASAPS